MNLIRDVIFALLLTSITGSLLMAAWMAVIYAGAGKRNVHYTWWMLKGVLAGYLFPVIYLIFSRFSDIIGFFYSALSFSNEQIDRGVLVLFLIWATGFVIFLLSRLNTWRCFWQMKRQSMAVPKKYLQVLQELCTEMNLQTSVSLYQGYGVESPFIFGVRNPKIYLPVQQLSGEELEMILYHELIHYKQGDTFWKPFFGLLGNIYWFNPFFRFLWRESVRWTEANCDFFCCEERFQAKEYFMLLLKMGSAGQSTLNDYAPMWTEGSRELEWRVRCMKRNRINKPKSIVIAVIIMLALLTGGVSAYVAIQGMERVYFEVYWNTADETEGNPRNELPEHEGTKEEFARMEVMSYTVGRKRTARSLTGNMEGKLCNNMICYVGEFEAYSEGEIIVAVSVIPEYKSIQVGVVKPDGKISYVKDTKHVSHIFKVLQTGTYKIFIWNTSGRKVAVDGFYCYSK